MGVKGTFITLVSMVSGLMSFNKSGAVRSLEFITVGHLGKQNSFVCPVVTLSVVLHSSGLV